MNEQPLSSKLLSDPTLRLRPETGGKGVSVAGNLLRLPVKHAGNGLVSVMALRRLRTVWVALMMVAGLAVSPVLAQSSTADLSVRKEVSNQTPAIGDVLTYTVVVSNALNSTMATGVVVKDEFPVGGLSYVPGSASVVRGSGTYAADTGIWTVGTVAPNDSSILILQGTVLSEGVWFNTAEVTAADQADPDSSPNNKILTEDDYDGVCFSVPITLYPGDEYTVTIPSGYDQIVWYRNDQPISSSTVSTSLAEVNSDGSLTFRSAGTYRFETFLNGCLQTNCCNIEVLPGLFGSLGDKVFVDANQDGQQGPIASEPGIPGVVVVLLDGNLTPVASTTTNSAGVYSFTGLSVGVPYSVSFATPTGYVSTSANIGSDLSDSDADPLTGVTTQTYSLTNGENNTTVDAGYYLPATGPTASLGAIVFLDNDGDGQQRGAGEIGVPGVRVTLYQNTTATQVATTTTDASGIYSFTGLTPGSGYFVIFDTTGLAARGFVLTLPNQGSDATDSDAGANGQTGFYSLVPGENNVTVNAGVKPSRFDLALRKTTAATSVAVGQNIDYTITVLNQGDVNAFNINVTDYIPTGMSLAAGNTTWTGSSTGLVTARMASLSAGASVDLPIILTVTTVPAGTTLVNSAEISSADNDTDPRNTPPTDVDSNSDSDPTNDGTAKDDVVTEDRKQNPGDDEDDSDSAPITVTATPIFDLALLKRVAPTQRLPILPGDQLTFEVKVFNQGTVAAQRIELSDYLPTGLVLTDANWTLTNGVATRILAGTLAAGQDTTVSLVVTVSRTVVGSSLVNSAEISSADNDADPRNAPPVDIDSNIDGDPTNDGTPKDDVVAENRKQNPGSDEDDSDIAPIIVVQPGIIGDKVFVDANQDGQQGDPTTEPGIPGVVVVLLDANLSPLTSTTTNTSGFYSFTGLTPGLPYSVSFVTPTGYVSTSANIGNDASDSDPDPATGITTQTYSLTNGEINTSVDAGFKAIFDLSITKNVLNAGPYSPGGQVVYEVVVRNNSPVPVYNVQIDDLLPSGLRFVSSAGSPDVTPILPQSGNPVSFSIAGPYAANGVASLTLTTQISSTYTAASVTNTAIVSRFTATTDATGPAAVDTNPANNTATVTVPVGTTASCAIAPPTLTVGTCATSTNTYSSTVVVTVNNPPQGQTLTITDGDISQPFATTVGASNTFMMVFNGAVSNGSSHTVVISLPGCGSTTLQYTAPASCSVAPPVCDTKPPVIACAIWEICKGSSTTLTASGCTGGTIRWSDGQSGAVVSVSPTVTTTYSASCVLNSCTSRASNLISVTVLDPQTPVITASPGSTVCAGTSVTLTATGCAGGTIVWSENRQTGASIVVTPFGRTTYTAQCRVGSCLSNPAQKTIEIGTDGPAPTIVCSTSVVCPGETVTLTVEGCVGTPVWSSTTQTTGSIVVTPAAGNNTYSVYCQNGSCTSKSSPVYTISVVAPVVPTVTASVDSVCVRGLVSLTATGCNGTVVWNATDRNGVSLTGAVINVNPDASISYFAQCRFRTCLSEPSNAVPVTVVNPATPIIQSDKSIVCSGETVTLTAEGCQGTVMWYGVNRTGASIQIVPTESKEYYATCKQGTCESEASNRVRVTVNTTAGAAPTIAASTTAVCSGGVVSLTATGCAGNVIWSDGQTGPVVSVTATPTNREFYAVCKVGTQCGSGRSNVITINVTPVPTPTVTCSTDTICPGEKVTLTVNNCQGTPYWSTNETTTSIVVSPTVTTGYSVYCQNGVCTSDTSATYTITVIPVPAPTIAASATAVEPGGTISLTATGCVGQVIWSANDINGNNIGAVIVVRPQGAQTYFAQCKFRECLSDQSTPITVNRSQGQGQANCSTLAGTLRAVSATVCASASTVEIAATPDRASVLPPGYSVVYVLTSRAESVVQQINTTPTFTVTATAADYTIHTLVYNGGSTDRNYLDLSLVRPGITTVADIVTLIADKNVCANISTSGARVAVTSVAPPTLSASSLTVCSGSSVTLTAAGCAGGVVNWSDGSTGESIVKTVLSDLQLMATCTLNGCTSGPSQVISITLSSPGVPTIASNRPSVCLGESVTLTAMGCEGGTLIWSDGVTVGNTLTVTPMADVSYRVTCKIGSCEGSSSATTTIKVGSPNAPTISVAGAGTVGSTTVCFGTPVTLTAQGCPANSYVTWSNDLVGTSITVSLANGGTYTARCCTSDNCKSAASNPIAITVLPKVASPVTIDRTNACPFTTVDPATGVTSRASTTGGVFEFYTSATLSSDSKVANPAAAGAGTYYAVEKTTNGCYSLPALIRVMITTCDEVQPCNAQNPATANAGADASICAAKSYQLSGAMGGAGRTAHWSSTGNGTFDNPFALNAIYTASAEDVMVGRITLTLSVSTNNAACPVATDAMQLTIEGSKSMPTVTVSGSTNFCAGDSVTLQAPAGSNYLWSNRARTQQIVVKNSGSYSVQLIDSQGCSSVKSADVVVTVAEPARTPLASNVRNACPAIVANLAAALFDSSAAGPYEYRIGASVSSPVVMRPDSVGAGTYYVFARNTAGCYSAPAPITVNIFNCTADTLTTDLGIVKTVNKTSVRVGEVVTYTVVVSNLGGNPATNVDVRDVLPDGLELIPDPAATYTFANGAISRYVERLNPEQSVSFAFDARVLSKGLIINKADIPYLDQRDSNLDNNWSKVMVQDTSAGRPSRIGLAKSVLRTPTALGDSLIRVSYGFVLTNFGDDTLRTVQVTDDLAYFFSPNAVAATTVTPQTTGSTLVPNRAFTGRGNDTALFDSASYLSPGRSQRFTLDVTVRRAAGDTTNTFQNIASVTAQNSVTAVYDLSADGSDPDPDGDGDPTNNTTFSRFTLGTDVLTGPGIGVALAVVRVDPQADSSYNVTYKATIRNMGDVPLFGIALADTLIRAFVAPTAYSVVGPPVVATGSSLVANAGYDGNAQTNLLMNTSTLAVGKQDTLLLTVNVRPNGNNGPFYSMAAATAYPADSSQIVRDVSNDGFDPTVAGAVMTAVRFNLPKGLLGVAKSVGTLTLVSEGVYDVPYTITLSNMGSVALKKVQVVDNLSETFKHGALIVSNTIAVTAGTGLTVDPDYTGQGLITKLLIDSLSSLPVGATNRLSFVVRVDVKNADSLTFYNTATATALTDANEPVADTSTAGASADPDNDLDPRNNSLATPVSLSNSAANGYIGVAMAVRDTIRQTDGSFTVTYQIVLQNYGSRALTNVSLTDSLAKVFNATTGSTYSIARAPFITSTGSALKLNPAFNGATDARIVLGDSISALAAGQVDTILVTLNVSTDGSTTRFLNSAYAQAKAGTRTVSDISTSGLNPDLNGNRNPTDLNEREATPLNLPSTSSALFIPQGFSPNGDGINDLFVIRGVGNQTIDLEIYNRWGHLVYKNNDYKNDWDGKPNTGITVGQESGTGLPDGTYYYVIKTSDGRQFVRYMTINR